MVGSDLETVRNVMGQPDSPTRPGDSRCVPDVYWRPGRPPTLDMAQRPRSGRIAMMIRSPRTCLASSMPCRPPCNPLRCAVERMTFRMTTFIWMSAAGPRNPLASGSLRFAVDGGSSVRSAYDRHAGALRAAVGRGAVQLETSPPLLARTNHGRHSIAAQFTGPPRSHGPPRRGGAVLASRLLSLSLTLVEFAVLVGANTAFHRFMRRRKSAEDVLRRNEQFARSVVDALPPHIAILDGNGIILATNRAWKEFAEANGGDPERMCEGVNYLIVCDGADGRRCTEASEFAAGIRGVLSGKHEEFSIEYPAHAPTERRWFIGASPGFPARKDMLTPGMFHGW